MDVKAILMNACSNLKGYQAAVADKNFNILKSSFKTFMVLFGNQK
jgi:hypothetical protein